MIELEKVLSEWKEDSQITRENLTEDSRITPALHSKYLEYLSLTKLRLRKAEFEQKHLLKEKWLYYSGKMPEEDIVERGWKPDPFDGLNPDTFLKKNKDLWYDTDKDIQQSEEKIVYLQTLIDTIKEIVENIKWRHQTIGNIIRWEVFKRGD